MDHENRSDQLCDDCEVSEFHKFIVANTDSEKKEDVDDPFLACNVSVVSERYRLWSEHLPEVKPFYAVKCNDDPVLLKTLSDLGLGFDCSSKDEIRSVLEIGVRPHDIIYANPCKQASHLRYAASQGVSMMTFDSEEELVKISSFYSNARLLIRLKVDDSEALYKLGMKFGCSLVQSFKLLKLASDLCLNVIGVSFHVGSLCQSSSVYRTALEMCSQLFNADTGHRLSIIDIGGGFPGTEIDNSLFVEMATTIKETVKLLFLDQKIEVIAEPGRYFATSAYSLAAQIIGKKKNDDNQTMLYVNDGIFGVLNIMKYEKTVSGPYPLRSLIDPKATLFAHCGVRPVTLLIRLEHTLSQT